MSETSASFDILDIALRLGGPVVVGMLIGLNRDLANKPIGVRTLGLVSLSGRPSSPSRRCTSGLWPTIPMR